MASSSSSPGALLTKHCHGKSRVRVGRVWREGGAGSEKHGRQSFREYECEVLMEAPLDRAFVSGDNSGMTTTDTTRNCCYHVAKSLPKDASPETFALAIAAHFLGAYPLVSGVQVTVECAAWERVAIAGAAHDHGFTKGRPTRWAFLVAKRGAAPQLSGGVRDLTVLKTTQSGYVGFLKDRHTRLPEVTERLLGTIVSATWKYSAAAARAGGADFDAAATRAKDALVATFFGPVRGGDYSKSVQETLYKMGAAALGAAPELDAIKLALPNLHFLPWDAPELGMKFQHDVYIATSEPHGSIHATVTRKGAPAVTAVLPRF